MSVQALGAEFAIETLDVAVVGRLAWSREIEDDALVVGPQIKVSGDELAAIVHTNGGRVTDLTAYPFERLDHVFPPSASGDDGDIAYRSLHHVSTK